MVPAWTGNGAGEWEHDLVFVKDTCECFHIDVAVADNYQLTMKEIEKITNYTELKIES